MQFVQNNKKPIILCILDGWGIAPQKTSSLSNINNAIIDANPKFYNYLLANYPHSQLLTSGEDVGLPPGQMGNSEVGHMTIGSGRVICQDLPKINKAIRTGDINQNHDLNKLLSNLQQSNKACHIMGLASDGGVHAHIEHLIFLAEFLAQNNIKTYLHLIADGRDSSPKSGNKFIQQIATQIKDKDLISIATISGRYFAMDRDKRFDRTQKYYDVITLGSNKTFNDPLVAIQASYAQEINDEFILPQAAFDYFGMEDNDALLMVNFRADRARQIILALGDTAFSDFKREKIIKFSSIITMAEYSKKISSFASAIFPTQIIHNTLAEILASYNLKQLRIAETEKYAHLTFFFNAGIETPVKGEDRILISSPKVATYDLKPEMSAFELTNKLLDSIESNKYDFILVNFANTDMVGHTGDYHATVKAVQVVDKCLKAIYTVLCRVGGILIVTADHGNAEQMFDEINNTVHTSHTTNSVPFIIVGSSIKKLQVIDGSLADIAPTILTLLDLPIPQEMTGKNLIIA